jgi:GntR family transcriptional regulator
MSAPRAEEPVELGPTGREVRRSILGMVQRGTLKPGEKLEAERELAVRLGVSRSTLRQALIAMEEQGVVRRVPGRGGGTFVASGKVDRDLSHIVGVPRLLRDQGFTAGSRVLSVAVALADVDAAEALGVPLGSGVVDLVRIRIADGVPISLERAVLPSALVPGLPERELSGSLYELLDREYALRPGEAIEHIEVVAATPDEARILEIDAGAPLILVTRTTTDAAGRLFEYSQDLFRADRIRISVKVQGSPHDEAPRLRGRIVEPLAAEQLGAARRRSLR